MNVRNCRNCGKLFNYITGPSLCPVCRQALEANFQEVKQYIREHTNVGIGEVSEACDVDPAQIRQWLRDDRLEVTADSPLMLNCECCGAPIRSGRFCDKCRSSMTNSFNGIIKENAAKNAGQNGNPGHGPKMRYF